MGQRSDADSLDAGFGDGSNGFQRDAAACFQQNLRGCFVSLPYGFAKLVGVHIVEQDDVGAAFQDVSKLLEGVDFKLDRHATGRLGASLPDGVGETRVTDEPGPGGDVVVFDEDAIEEAHAMVGSAACSDSILGETSPTGQRLASVEDRRGCAFYRLDELVCEAGDAAQVPDEVKSRPLADEDSCQWSSSAGDDLSRLNQSSVGNFRHPADEWIDFIEDEFADRQPGNDSGLASNDQHFRSVGLADQRVAGQVADSGEVFLECQIDQSIGGVAIRIGEFESRILHGNACVFALVRRDAPYERFCNSA